MSIISNYNLVKKITAFPCANPNPLIWAVTALPAVTPAILDFAAFGCRDIQKFRMGKGAPCGRAMKAQFKGAIPPKFVSTVDKLLGFEKAFSTVGNWWLIADLATDSVARWTTMAYQLAGCADVNTGSSWDIVFSAPEILNPGVPTLIGGAVTNVHGDGTGVSPIGVNCPADYYAQIHFNVKARTLDASTFVPLTTWIRRVGGGTYDYEATRRREGYPWQVFENHYLFDTQNTGIGFPVQYEMYAMSQVQALTTELNAQCVCSPTNPTLDFLAPLACLRDMLSEHIANPAGRNRTSRNPLIPGVNQPELNPRPRRGPPGGKPRSRK